MKLFSILISLLCSTSLYAQDSLLTIGDAVHLALENNYAVIISKNEIEIGQINNNWAAAGRYPLVSGTAAKSVTLNNLQQKLNNGTTIKTNYATLQNISAGVNANWRVFNGYKMWATKKRLEELEKAGELNFRKVVNETLYDVVVAYYNVVRLRRQLKSNDNQLELFQERLKIADVRFKIGSAAKNDLLQAQVDLNEQAANRINIRNSMELAMVTLNNLIGRKPEVKFQVVDSIYLNPLPDSAELRSKIELANPDVLLAQNMLAVQIQSRKEINAGRLPVITINGNYNFVKSSNSAGFNLFNQNFGPSASVGIAVPIFNGGVIKKQLKVADIEMKNQQVAITKLKTDLNANMVSAYINYRNALAIVELERKNLLLASENITIASARFRMLNITSVELRQVQISYIDAENRLYDALYQAKLAESELSLLTGDIANL